MMRRQNESEEVSEAAVIIDIPQRRIMLVGDLTPIAAAQVIQALIAMNDAKKARLHPIEFWIHSGGGSPTAASAICDVMQYVVDADVLTVGMGLVCSAATLPLLLGDQRLVFPNSELMIHGASRNSESEMTRADVRFYSRIIAMCEQTRESLAASNRRVSDALVGRAGWDLASALRVLDDGMEHWFFGGRSIVDAGLADAVLGIAAEKETT